MIIDRSIGALAVRVTFDILAAVKRTAIPHHATFLEWSLNGVDASRDAASLTEVNPLLSVVKVQFLAWLSLFPL